VQGGYGMLFRVAICENEKTVLDELSEQISAALSDVLADFSVESFLSAEAMLKQLDARSFNAFFLDIDMPEIDGIRLGMTLREQVPNSCIVFISSREDRVFDTFAVSPVRFVRKSKLLEEIDEAVSMVCALWEQRKNRKLVVSSRDQVNTFQIDEIEYIESFGKAQHVFTKTQTKTIRFTMAELENKLRPYGFLKPHKGYLVNYKFIRSIGTSGIVLQSGIALPVSRRRIVEIKQEFIRLVSAEPNIRSPQRIQPKQDASQS